MGDETPHLSASQTVWKSSLHAWRTRSLSWRLRFAGVQEALSEASIGIAVDGAVKKAGNESYSISQLIAAFLRFAKKHYGADNAQFGHCGRLGNRIRKLYGPTVAAEFGSLQFKAIRNEMVLEGKARSYVNETMKRLVRIFRCGVGAELVPPKIGALLREIEPLKRG